MEPEEYDLTDTFAFKVHPQLLFALSPHATKLYLVLRALCKAGTSEATIARSKLGVFMGRAPKNVDRHLAELVGHGVVVVRRNQHPDGGHAANTYIVKDLV